MVFVFLFLTYFMIISRSIHVAVNGIISFFFMGYPGDSAVKNLPAMQEPQETWVQSLQWEDPLQEGMAAHSSIPAWRIPWTEKPSGLQSLGSQRVGHDTTEVT